MVAIEERESSVHSGRSHAFELQSVSAAVEMVASGRAARIALCNLVHGDALLAECAATATLRGIVLEPRRVGRQGVSDSAEITEIRVRRA